MESSKQNLSKERRQVAPSAGELLGHRSSSVGLLDLLALLFLSSYLFVSDSPHLSLCPFFSCQLDVNARLSLLILWVFDFFPFGNVFLFFLFFDLLRLFLLFLFVCDVPGIKTAMPGASSTPSLSSSRGSLDGGNKDLRSRNLEEERCRFDHVSTSKQYLYCSTLYLLGLTVLQRFSTAVCFYWATSMAFINLQHPLYFNSLLLKIFCVGFVGWFSCRS